MVRGTVVAARDQYGDGRAFVYRVRYPGVKNSPVETEFYPGRVRGVTGATAGSPKDTAPSNALFYGDFVCRNSFYTGSLQPSLGILSLKAGGAYTFRGMAGRYKYNASSGQITWTSGYLAEDENTTKFKRGNTTAQIDISFHTASGDLNWGCGTNLK